MQKIWILNKRGIWEYKEWDYKPENNPEALEKAKRKLEKLGITNAKIFEVAPEVFWYELPNGEIECEEYT